MTQHYTFKSLYRQIKTQKSDFWRTNLYGMAATLLLLPIPMLLPLLIDEVLLENPELMSRAKRLIDTNKNAVSQVLAGNRGLIENTGEILSFLDAYAKRSPSAMKAVTKMVRSKMIAKQKKGGLFWGFRLKHRPSGDVSSQ